MIILKALLQFLLSLDQSHAGEVLAQITTRLAKTDITHGGFQHEKRLKVLPKPLISTGTFTNHQTTGVIWKILAPASSLLPVNDAGNSGSRRQYNADDIRSNYSPYPHTPWTSSRF